ncbi:glycosyltransferase family 2 protein [Bacteroides sp. AM16-24]|uniref:glycosyltransferase n=1 Tax=Bacteroides sp. AM16-24 TaxID=2292002 RepID=UPI000E554B86|nr:glycosyltransferase family 2 protein [Bacteroides sp. AM16-24]RHI03379.1 glycosyltransferase family 2 protein [Bacteroides sp. AM16-24]
MEQILLILDWILYVLFAINILYLLVYSLASLRRRPAKMAPAEEHKRIALLIAAYREDAVIMDTVQACLVQDYPSDRYDVVVISDHMRPSTNEKLRALPIKLLQVDFEKSTNTKSLKAALEYLGKDSYDIALIIDADNIVNSSYLVELNNAFADPKVQVVQTHRVAKNLNTNMAYLDAISEEINNSIFRLGHVNLGMSAALIGSGMAFEYSLFYKAMMSNTSVGGFDRVLEMKLLYHRIFFHYLPDTYVLDEKIQKTKNFYQQRRRWLSAQYYSFGEFVNHLFPAIRDRKWDFCDKLFQQASFSRVLLLGFTFIFSVCLSIWIPALAYKWWVIFGVLLLALAVAIPRRFWKWRLVKAICFVPYSFLLMFINLFRLKEANKKFIHTAHGIEE